MKLEEGDQVEFSQNGTVVRKLIIYLIICLSCELVLADSDKEEKLEIVNSL